MLTTQENVRMRIRYFLLRNLKRHIYHLVLREYRDQLGNQTGEIEESRNPGQFIEIESWLDRD